MSQKILIADDDPIVLKIVRHKLQNHAYVITEVRDGDSLVREAKSIRPDLIISDFWLPHKNGLAALQEIRAHPELKSTPVVMLTARTSEEALIECLEGGADDFMTKPFSPDELLVRIRRLIRSEGRNR